MASKKTVRKKSVRPAEPVAPDAPPGSPEAAEAPVAPPGEPAAKKRPARNRKSRLAAPDLPDESTPDEPAPDRSGAEPAPGVDGLPIEPGYKDELNLAEFPIAALTDRVPDGQLSLSYEDSLEQREGSPIVRRLTIMGTQKHGLPTALDDEVMLGLIQLTKRRNNFTDAKVTFSRYELIDLLGWPQTGQSYRRIEEALHRWVGIVLMYENAWWDNSAKSWVDENFHVLDNVTLYDRERRRGGGKAAGPGGSGKRGAARRAAPGPDGAPLPLSSFRWNEVMFRSFQSGNLKQLDLEFYLSLRLPTTKRMFRFLDKRFYRRERLDFDLRTLACEHIGLSRSYKPTELKRRLRPALDELEETGYLEVLSADERYSFQRKGQWRILFIRGPRGRADQAAAEPAAEAALLVEALTGHGIAPRVAAELVETHPSSRIRTKLEVFDWLVQNEDKRVAKNPAGYLVASIRDDYVAPAGYRASPDSSSSSATVPPPAPDTEARRATPTVAERRRQAAAQAAEEAAAAQREARLRTAWSALSDAQREAIMARVRAENPGLRRWKSLLEPLCLAELDRLQNSGEPLPCTPAQPSLFPEDSGSGD